MYKVEVSLYIHVPFCSHKCGYCHFFVLPDKEELKKQYLHSLHQEWQLQKHLFEDKKIVSIYFGGGTPSLLAPEAIASILSWIKPKNADCEITLEANPESVTAEKMEKLKEAGINRISLGIQSLDDSMLARLDRRHQATVARRAIEMVQRAGIQNLSIDLMYDLPGQTLESFESTLKEARELPISHLSLYNLTIEPGTAFFRQKKELLPSLPSDEASLAMLNRAVALLEEREIIRYEISAFAKNGAISHHNTGYWRGRAFIGLGPSAFSYWDTKRFSNVSNLNKYTEALNNGVLPIGFEEKLEFPDNLHELLAIALRLLEGVNLDAFQKEWGKLPEATLQTLNALEIEGYLVTRSNRICLTERGTLFYDTVATRII